MIAACSWHAVHGIADSVYMLNILTHCQLTEANTLHLQGSYKVAGAASLVCNLAQGCVLTSSLGQVQYQVCFSCGSTVCSSVIAAL